MLIITGPTAIGKSSLAVTIAQKFNGEIISADSMQIYKGCNIGTGKITETEKQGVRHHLIDIINPDCNFTVADYREAADRVIADVRSRKKLPIIVGGTGFYIKGILYDYGYGDAASNVLIRQKYENIYHAEGSIYLHDLLKNTDPETAGIIHPNDIKRVIRALEIYEITGKKKSAYFDGIRSRYDNFKIIVLNTERADLYNRINNRVDSMMKDGLLNEVVSLKEYINCNSMQAIGYKELFSYISGECSLNDAVELIKKNTRNYAKRQLTFFRKMDAEWIDIKQDIVSTMSGIIQNILTKG